MRTEKCSLSSFFRYIFCNIFQAAVHKSADFVQRLGFCVFVGLQATNRLTVKATGFTKPVGRNFSFIHQLPKFAKRDHTHRSFWLILFYYFAYGFLVDVRPKR